MTDIPENVDNQLWRLREGQADIYKRFDRLDARIDKLEARLEHAELKQWRLDTLEYRLVEFGKKLDEIDKKPPAVVTGMMGDSTVRVIIYGLIAGVVALAGGQAINLTGLLK